MRTQLAELSFHLGNIGQVSLASWIGTTQQSVSHWRTGKTKPSGAVRNLIELALKVPHLLDMSEAGGDGMRRLVAVVGVHRACAMVDGSRGRVVDRLAWLVERCASMAPEVLGEPAAPSVEAAPQAKPAGNKFDRAARASSWPESWTSPDGIIVRIPEDLRGWTEQEIMPYLEPKAERIKAAGKWHNFDEPLR